ncbi:unnamed protein product [Soboliphyme baturini]|uniref:PIN7 domain-containing protein n=1 Tax=Soboliphyme baturini TaxID=241478 RepID=A0A183IA10_9BILA|nr:unnamed protein product [Soboliphyme baturini]
MPDARFLRVVLKENSTAKDVVRFCTVKYNLASTYLLSANFDGLANSEKHFDEHERLYKLVKKFVIGGGRGKDVTFYLTAVKKKITSR